MIRNYGLLLRNLDTIIDWSEALAYSPRTFTVRGEFVDTYKYDIVPKESYKQSLLKQKEDELKELDEYYERRKKEIADERKRLTG